VTILKRETAARRAFIWVLVYAIPTFQATLPVEDPDFWWHLRTGQWIVEHGWVPMVDAFSAHGMGKPWVAYSWLFEIIIYAIYSVVGLVGIVIFTVVMSLLIALAVHALMRMARLPFVLEVVVMAVALGSLKPMISPRSWLFTILFFALELSVLLNVRRSGNTNLLWTLPALFALWANIHIQFIYGLAAVVFLVMEVVVSQLRGSTPETKALAGLPLARLCGVAATCVLATFFTPYHYHLFRPIIEISAQTGVFSTVAELHPLLFRSLADWFVLALVLVAVFLLGWGRQWRVFPSLLLLMGVFLAFRARRDAWVVVVAALAVICEFRRNAVAADVYSFSRSGIVAIAAAVALSTFLIGNYRGITNQQLERVVEQQFPVKAVEFIIHHQLPGPLFNNFDWGGYLIWHLHGWPVSIDNRGNVHGDERIERSLATWSGAAGWSDDPDLANARLVVGELGRPLISLLRLDPRFKLVYEDSTAVVFVRASGKN